jgi:hypothetical protein
VFFLVAGLLVFLWLTRDPSCASRVRWFLWGLCTGWAAAIRLDSIPVFGTLTLCSVCLVRPKPLELAECCAWLLVGAVAPLGYAVWYNHHYCGSWLRDPHCFWSSIPYDSSASLFGIRMAFGAPDCAQEFGNGGNLVFYGRTIVAQMARWEALHTLERIAGPCLTGFMIAGIVYAWRQRNANTLRFRFLAFTAVEAITTLLFFVFLRWRIIRFIVPVAPVMACFVGVGLVESIRLLWHKLLGKALAGLLLLAFSMAVFIQLRVPHTRVGDVLPVVQILQESSTLMESNAVVISTAGPYLTDFFAIRGTQRAYVPPDKKTIWRVQPHPPLNRAIIPSTPNLENTYPGDLDNGAMDIFGYSALENPEEING